MAGLPDWKLRSWAEAGGVKPWNPENLNPASLNLTIGPGVMVEPSQAATMGLPGRAYDWASGLFRVNLEDLPEQRLWVPSGGWILAEVAEWVKIPSSLEAVLCLRSSAARAGWDHCLAGYVDPGYEGRLTLELVNCRRDCSLPLVLGSQLIQIRLSRLEDIPETDYGETGRYQGDAAVSGCKDPSVGGVK
jgi:dCTP deaminase